MADHYKGVVGAVALKEPSAAKRTIYYDVNTDEAQVITVSKAGGTFAATAGSVATKVAAKLYKLVLHVDDIDTPGYLAVLSTGVTDAHYLIVRVGGPDTLV